MWLYAVCRRDVTKTYGMNNLNYDQKLSLLHSLLTLIRVDNIESENEVDFIYQLGKKNLEKIFEVFFQQIKDSLLNKKSVEIRSLGTFFIKEIKEKKQARNPKTGEIIYVPKRNKIRFRASKRLKELINK